LCIDVDREVFDSEKSRLRSQLESSQHGFTTVKKQYAEVEVWQRHLQDGNIKLLAEKGKLLAQYVTMACAIGKEQ